MTQDEQTQGNRIATLQDPSSEAESRGYWADAWIRLRKNRFAVIGLVIIAVNMLMAVFAPLVSVEGIDDQNTDEANAAPEWVVAVFTTLKIRDEAWEIEGGTTPVTTGQAVEEGDLLVDFSSQNVTAPVAGTVFVSDRRLELAAGEVPRYTIDNPDALQVEDGEDVTLGQTLFGDTTAPINGEVHILDDQLLIQPETTLRRSRGEPVVETGQTVDVGDVLMTVEDGEDIIAPMAGTVFLTRNNIEISQLEIVRIPRTEDMEIHVRDGRDVDVGELLYDDVTAEVSGTVFLTEDEILVRPRASWLHTGTVSVENGQQVEPGDLLIDLSVNNIYANMDGTVFVVDGEVQLTREPVYSFTIPQGAELEVRDGQPVQEGTPLFGDEAAPETGVVYVVDDTLYVRSANEGGYVALRNEYPLGADYLGRDLWSRLVYGARVSLLVALIGPTVSLFVGVPYGLISGYFGGAVDNWMMRFVDLMYAFPTLLLVILLMAFFRSSAAATQQGTFIYSMGELDRSTGGMFFIFLGIGLTAWMRLARLTRGQVLYVREQEYVIAARAQGAPTGMIIRRHILPNVLGPIIISETLAIPTYIRFEAFLSFIGLGVNAPTPSWGNMISDGAAVLRDYPHEALFPAFALFLIMFAFNFLGDGLRDALDPRLRGTD